MLKRLIKVGLVTGAALAAVSTANRLRRLLNPVTEHEPWPAVPAAPTRSRIERPTGPSRPSSSAEHAPVKGSTNNSVATEQAWVEPVEGACPTGFAVKAKVRSGIFRTADMAGYDTTVADRCYPDEESAIADGLHKAHH